MAEMGGGKRETGGCHVRMKENRMEKSEWKVFKWPYKKTKLLFFSFYFLDRLWLFTKHFKQMDSASLSLVLPALMWSYKNNTVNNEKVFIIQCHTHPLTLLHIWKLSFEERTWTLMQYLSVAVISCESPLDLTGKRFWPWKNSSVCKKVHHLI